MNYKFKAKSIFFLLHRCGPHVQIVSFRGNDASATWSPILSCVAQWWWDTGSDYSGQSSTSNLIAAAAHPLLARAISGHCAVWLVYHPTGRVARDKCSRPAPSQRYLAPPGVVGSDATVCYAVRSFPLFSSSPSPRMAIGSDWCLSIQLFSWEIPSSSLSICVYQGYWETCWMTLVSRLNASTHRPR